MTPRHSGVFRFIGGIVGISLVGTGVASAQVNRNSSNSGPGILQTGETASSYSSSNSSSDDETAAYIARGYASTMDENEQRLTIISDSLLTESVCDGAPMIILKSSTAPVNGACLAAQSRYNLSCSCLSGYANTTEWNFHIRAPDSEPASPLPTTDSGENTVQVDSLMLLDTPSDLLVFKIQGESSNPVPVNLEKATTGDDNLAIVRAQESSVLTKVDIYNLDFGDIPIEADFVPTTLTDLLMRHCNITSLSQSFLESFTALKSLNLSGNKMSSIYASLLGSTEALNAMTKINLANNSFTEFPVQLLQFPNLQKLDLSGNPIENLTVSSDDLAAISRLSFFQIDPPVKFGNNGSDCTNGGWKEVHNTKFCVVNSTSSAPIPEVVAQGAVENTTNWTIFVLIAAFGGCFVGFWLFFLATKFVKHQQEHQHKGNSSSPAAEDVQTSRANTEPAAVYNSLHPTLNADLLNDPLIMSFRLKYTDVHVDHCISKGGFGLVYSGIYKHRRVAIKKIMREKCEKLSQIRMFIREITLMGSLRHERIVEFIGVAWDSLRNLSAVTEYMERGDLRDVLHALKHQGSSDHGLNWHGKKLTIALHIAEGLSYMHSRNPKVIHRDLKSKNVLLNNAYEAKLSDFGVSRERQVANVQGGPGRFMTPGVGTSFWIAPEVLLGRDYDERADVFSFGVVLSEIDTDDYPYWNSGSIPGQDNPDERRSQEQKILEKVALGALRPTFYNDCPPGVLALAASCLEGRPEDRPSASEVVLTIKELMREMQFHNRPQSEPEPDVIVTEGFLSSA
ncbi:hypothetical protein V7S43_003304 [Phytophthora oleae]|uniref:Protein kinase domain-containing protein n=1 Tax=Phytophthora oleae TaxID=2107226 RepID=A0ABD3FXA9_9STRA